MGERKSAGASRLLFVGIALIVLGTVAEAAPADAGGTLVNLVGAEGHTGEVVYQQIEEIMAMEGVTTHIYGKKQTRPFRKMGHVTIVNKDIAVARKIAEEVKKTIKVISK